MRTCSICLSVLDLLHLPHHSTPLTLLPQMKGFHFVLWLNNIPLWYIQMWVYTCLRRYISHFIIYLLLMDTWLCPHLGCYEHSSTHEGTDISPKYWFLYLWIHPVGKNLWDIDLKQKIFFFEVYNPKSKDKQKQNLRNKITSNLKNLSHRKEKANKLRENLRNRRVLCQLHAQ